MRRKVWGLGLGSLAAVLLALSGCSAHGTKDPGGVNGGGGGSGGPSFGGGGSGGSSNPPGKTLLYAHTDTTLYQLDPENISAAMTRLGDFDCIGGGSSAPSAMTDLGVTKDGQLFGVSEGAAYPLAAGRVRGALARVPAICTPQPATQED